MASRKDIVRGIEQDKKLFHNFDLSKVDLSGLDLDYAELKNCKLNGANFSKASLWRANFHNSNVRKARFREAFMHEAKLWDADFSGADLSRAFLQSSELFGTKLKGANFKLADMRYAKIKDANFDSASFTKTRGNPSAGYTRAEETTLKFNPQVKSPYMSEHMALSILEPRSRDSGLRYSPTGLEALFYLLSIGDGHTVTLITLGGWHFEGASQNRELAVPGVRDIKGKNYRKVCDAYTYYAENYLVGLDALTKGICDGFERLPMPIHDSLIEIFLNMDPQKVLPETKGRIDTILNSPVKQLPQAKAFKEFKRAMPGKRFWSR